MLWILWPLAPEIVVADPLETCEFNDRFNGVFNGPPTKTQSVADVDECEKLCCEDDKCEVWNFKVDDKSCDFKLLGITFTADSGHTSAILNRMEACESYDRVDGIYTGATTLEQTVADADECEKTCCTEACDVWTFRASDKACIHTVLDVYPKEQSGHFAAIKKPSIPPPPRTATEVCAGRLKYDCKFSKCAWTKDDTCVERGTVDCTHIKLKRSCRNDVNRCHWNDLLEGCYAIGTSDPPCASASYSRSCRRSNSAKSAGGCVWKGPPARKCFDVEDMACDDAWTVRLCSKVNRYSSNSCNWDKETRMCSPALA